MVLLRAESPDYCLFVNIAGLELGGREIGAVGGIGEVLAFQRNAVVVVIDVAVLAGGATLKPVAGVDLDAGLGGEHLEQASGCRGIEFGSL